MSDVILAVCPNPVLDVTYKVDDATPGTTHGVRSVRSRAGGKGVNVVRVASQLGTAATVLGFSVGRSGDELIAGLHQSGIAHDLVAVDGETRRTLAVVTPTETTMFNEPGPQINPGQWDTLASSVRTASAQAGVVTVSGSVPLGTPADGNPTGRPAILQISHNAVRFHDSLLSIAPATATVADGCEAPLALHLDHVEDESLLLQAGDTGAAGAARFVRSRRRATASSCRCRDAEDQRRHCAEHRLHRCGASDTADADVHRSAQVPDAGA